MPMGASKREEVMRVVQEILKGLGVSNLEVSIINNKSKKELAKYMYQLAEELRDPTYKVEARKAEEADVILLMGLKDGGEVAKMDCGACGFESCEDMLNNRRAGLLFPGPTCIVRAVNFGMAVGFLVGTCLIPSEDSKTMLRIGVAAKRLGFLKSDLVIGLPLTSSGTSSISSSEGSCIVTRNLKH